MKKYQKQLVNKGQMNIFDFIDQILIKKVLKYNFKGKYYISASTKMKGYIGFLHKIYLDETVFIETICFPTKCKWGNKLMKVL